MLFSYQSAISLRTLLCRACNADTVDKQLVETSPTASIWYRMEMCRDKGNLNGMTARFERRKRVNGFIWPVKGYGNDFCFFNYINPDIGNRLIRISCRSPEKCSRKRYGTLRFSKWSQYVFSTTSRPPVSSEVWHELLAARVVSESSPIIQHQIRGCRKVWTWDPSARSAVSIWTSRLTIFYQSCEVKAACESKNGNLQRINHRHFALKLSPFYHLLFLSPLLRSEFLQLCDRLLNGVLPLFQIRGLNLIDSA